MTKRRWKWFPEFFSCRQNIQLFVSALSIHLVISFLYPSSLLAVASGVLTIKDLQLEYNIEGTELGAPVDKVDDRSITRNYTGTFTKGSTLILSGTGKIDAAYNVGSGLVWDSGLLVDINAGTVTKHYGYASPTGPGFSQPYNIQLQLPVDAITASFKIFIHMQLYEDPYCLVGSCYDTISVEGTLSAAQPTPTPSNTIGSTRGGKDDNPKTVHDGGNGPAKCGEAGLPNYWINTSSLNLAVQDNVCMYPGRGPQLAMTHSWNSDPSKSGMFGKGWRFAYEWGITKTASGATLRKGSGQELTYTGSTSTPPSALAPPSGFFDTLTWMGTYWLMVAKDTKWTCRFDKAVISGQTSDTEYSLTSITDTNGNAVTLAYTSGNVIQKITDSVGRVTTFTYDASNRVIDMDAPDGRFATYQYDGSGNLVQSVDLLGTVTKYTYDSSGYMTTMTVGDKTAVFTYTSVNNIMRVASVKDANGYTTTYALSGSTVTKTDPLGNTTLYTGTSEGFTSVITDPLSNTVTTQFSGGNPVTITDALGKQTTKTYDARGNVTKITDAKGYFTTFTYDSNDNMTSNTDALGKKTTFTYDAKNNLTKIASPLNNQTTMEYDAYGQMTGITNPAGKKTTSTYTSHGNVATVTDPLSNQTKYEYDAKGINKTAVTDQRGNKTTFSYDANNRLTGVTNPDGTSRTYTYDCCSPTGVIDEKGNKTTFNRDKVLNLTKVTNPVGSLTQMMYDGNANLIKVTDPLSRNTTNTYDKANRIVLSTNPLSGPINYSYDGNGNLTALADERSKQTKFTYDVNSRLVTNTNPLNAVTQFVRDELGRVKQIINPQSGEILFHFDADGRMMDKYFGTKNVATFKYDSNGNIISVVDSVGSSAFTYSARNELTGITWQDGATATFTYDKTGNIGGIQYPGGLSAIYTYDSRNRVQKVTWGSVTDSFEYDLAGNLVKETRSNGTVSEYTYDAANRLTGVNHKKGSTSFAQMKYDRDAVGNTVKENSSTVTPLTLATESYSGVFNDANQISTWGSDTYTYDKDGNLSTVTGARQMTAVYDPEARLLLLALGGTTSTYAYNGLGARVSKIQGSATTKYHYDHLGRLLFETDQSGKVIASYCYAGAVLVAMQASNGAVYNYHFDKTGNTLALTDAGGNIANAYLYEPFGKVMTQTGTVRNPFTYVGAFGVMDEGNGVYYMKNRYYDASTGKFIQKDPIGFAGGINLYAYVGNNPVERVDPEGLSWKEFDMGMTNAATSLVTGIFTGMGIIAIGASTAASAPLLIGGVTVIGLGAYTYGVYSKAKAQLAAADQGKRTFDPNNRCEVIAASPLGGLPFGNAIANWWYPEGKTSTMLKEAGISGLKILVPMQLSLPR